MYQAESGERYIYIILINSLLIELLSWFFFSHKGVDFGHLSEISVINLLKEYYMCQIKKLDKHWPLK
jgi:hypothetical protein